MPTPCSRPIPISVTENPTFNATQRQYLFWRVADAVQVGVRILDHQALYRFGLLREDPEAHRAAVILHTEDVGLESELVEEDADEGGKIINV